jgi:hypothetical protein
VPKHTLGPADAKGIGILPVELGIRSRINFTNMINEKYRWPDGKECAYCRRAFKDTAPSVRKTKDHIIPHSKGGVNDITNYVTCCHECNAIKANLHLTVFAEIILNIRPGGPLYRLRETISFNAWKIFNKYGRPYTNLYHKHEYQIAKKNK